ncbi:MAG: 1-acyl-sn-glycerol-3-phosphate acyltransferase, partial [Rhodospirillales bacterium]|nr:1-acyl-sn-glycerol-3-phosphate acyltransferase [Rhodospirillales bacterium]
RRSFKKFRGNIIVEFLPPMPGGMERREFLTQLEERIETATSRLESEFFTPNAISGPQTIKSGIP